MWVSLLKWTPLPNRIVLNTTDAVGGTVRVRCDASLTQLRLNSVAVGLRAAAHTLATALCAASRGAHIVAITALRLQADAVAVGLLHPAAPPARLQRNLLLSVLVRCLSDHCMRLVIGCGVRLSLLMRLAAVRLA